MFKVVFCFKYYAWRAQLSCLKVWVITEIQNQNNKARNRYPCCLMGEGVSVFHPKYTHQLEGSNN